MTQSPRRRFSNRVVISAMKRLPFLQRHPTQYTFSACLTTVQVRAHQTNATAAHHKLTPHKAEILQHLHQPLLRASSSLSRDTAARRFFTFSRSSNSRKCSLLAPDCAADLVGASFVRSISSLTKSHAWVQFFSRDRRLAFKVRYSNTI